jgi:hypothetical protein
MPEVSHKCTIRDDGTVDLSESELIKWAIQNEDILNYIGHRGMSSPYTVFDPETGKWKGVDNHLTTEEARILSSEEILASQLDKNKRTLQGQKELEAAFDKVCFADEEERKFASVFDLAIEMKVSEKTVRRRVEKSPYLFVRNSVVYEYTSSEF